MKTEDIGMEQPGTRPAENTASGLGIIGLGIVYCAIPMRRSDP